MLTHQELYHYLVSLSKEWPIHAMYDYNMYNSLKVQRIHSNQQFSSIVVDNNIVH